MLEDWILLTHSEWQANCESWSYNWLIVMGTMTERSCPGTFFAMEEAQCFVYVCLIEKAVIIYAYIVILVAELSSF